MRGILCFNCNGGLGQFRDSARHPARGRCVPRLRTITTSRSSRDWPWRGRGSCGERPYRLARDVRLTVARVRRHVVRARAGTLVPRSSTCCARSHRTISRAPAAAAAGAGHRVRDHPRHDRARHPLRRRRGHGRRPPGDRRVHDRQPAHGQGLPGRRLLRRRHRRCGRARDGDGAPLPGAARALREDRGRAPQPRRQGQPARPDGAGQPAGGDGRLRGRAAVRGLRRQAGPRPGVQLRRHRRQVRGDRLPDQRLRRRARPQLDQGVLEARA